MGYIKSYSNYIIQQKHQLLNNGTVFERDFSTIGGIGDNFNSKQKFYRQGTFVYSINGEIITPKLYSHNLWKQNGDKDIWTKSDITENINEQKSLDIVLKQDYYKLKDFAYYGSCTELIRGGINDIINRFPGELYAPIINDNGIVVVKSDKKPLNDENEFIYLVDNPFSLDLHTNAYAFNLEESVDIKNISANFNKYDYYNGKEIQPITKIVVNDIKEQGCFPYCFKIVTIKSNNEKDDFIIHCYYDENGKICYLTNKNNLGKYIRPKEKYLNEFYQSLDAFQKILLNKDSKPKYSTIFEVIEETDEGYKSFFQKFIFPISYGGYNLDIKSSKFFDYVDSLSKYSELLDEVYCNNLYRQMTHESIKNFDWTDELNRNGESKEEYVTNGEKFQKMLQLFAREFDEIKFYIDGIKNSQLITYNDVNNLPDYFLTDTLNIEGWDVKNIFPFKITNNYFEEDLNLTIQPYKSSYINFPTGYFSGYFSEDCHQTKIEATTPYKTDNKNYLRERIKQYVSDKCYTMQELNNKFMKYLKLNSRSIFQKKGTIESIESLLSLFGLRSKRWYESIDARTQHRLIENRNETVNYDYEIKEYVAITNALEDEANQNNNLPNAEYLIDYFNSTKSIVYNTVEYQNKKYVPYRGLPVRYYEKINGETTHRFLYPYFSTNIIIDGKPYYQMNGGWLHKNYAYTALSIEDENKGGYVDTNTLIPIVDNLNDLFNIQNENLYNNIIYYVKNIIGDYVCVDGVLYDIITDTTKEIRYFIIKITNKTLIIGQQRWNGQINTYNEDGNVVSIDLNQYEDGANMKIYINEFNIIHISQDETFLIKYSIIKDGNLISTDTNDIRKPTNYFILYDTSWYNTLGLYGWNQIEESSDEYQTIQKIKRDYHANNPHTNGLKYDDGIEYIKYFDQLFKYAISTESFNKNCYSSLQEYMTSLNKMEYIGFDNLLQWNDDLCKYNIKLYEDTKIHQFCHYYNNVNTYYFTELDNITIKTEEVFVKENTLHLDAMVKNNIIHINGNYQNKILYLSPSNKIYTFYDTLDYANLKEDENLQNTYEKNITCLDQIINVKNIDLIFTKQADTIKQMKYIDEVILHYLSQILPSNIILNIKFTE